MNIKRNIQRNRQMRYNLRYLRKFSVFRDLGIMAETVLAVLR